MREWRNRRRAVPLMGLVVASAGAAFGAWPSGERADAQGTGDPVIFAAGDIACGSDTSGGSCRQMETSNLFVNAGADAVLPLGDVQYEKGQLSNFQGHYHGSWGRAKAITRPAIGNHELGDPAGQGTGYWDYFNGVGVRNGPAGERGKGYYSYDLGTWHLIALNSNCSQASCSAGGAQDTWLRADLDAHLNRCTLVYMHHPRWTSDTRDFDKPELDPLLRTMYAYGVDVLLVGHSHFYERFAPQDPDQRLDTANGTRHFIVGTGGRNVYGFGTIEPNSQVRNGNTFGVLRMDLHPQGYDWRFVPVAGSTFTDSGSAGCHRTTTDTDPPAAPTGLAATTHGANRVTLSWNPSTDVGTGIARYRVYRDGLQIGTATDTSYEDDTVGPDTTYAYHVVAEDGGGNPSPPTESVTVTTPPPNQLITLTAPVDDAHVQAASPTVNAGAAAALEVDRSPVMDTLLKFDVAGVGSREVVGATLRMHAVDSSGMGGAFFKAASNDWSEGTLTWNNAPATTGAELSSLGSVRAGTWYETDVTKAVTGDGPVSLRITSSSSDGVDYASSEGVAGLAPQLLISVPAGAPSAPDTTITEHPSDPSSSPDASFSFTASQSGAHFECRLDTGTWQACTSPAAYTGLGNGSHTFDVRAIDGAGTADATPASFTWTIDTAIPQVLSFIPSHDTFVRADQPDASFGSSTSLQVDNSPIKHILLKFPVTGVGARSVVKATLRLYNTNLSARGGDVRRATSSSWSEGTVTYNTAPGHDATITGSFGAVAPGNWFEVDVTALVDGDGTVSLKITSTSADGADYSSSEGPAGFAPELQVTVR